MMYTMDYVMYCRCRMESKLSNHQHRHRHRHHVVGCWLLVLDIIMYFLDTRYTYRNDYEIIQQQQQQHKQKLLMFESSMNIEYVISRNR